MALHFDHQGNLPPGIHLASWDEIVSLCGGTARRHELLYGLREAVRALKRAGCRRMYVDGSFTTAKEANYGEPPGDFDGCWEPEGVNPQLLDPVLLDFKDSRKAQKAKFGGELFISKAPAAPDGSVFLDFFQVDKRTGAPKGIIALDLLSLDESELDVDLTFNGEIEAPPTRRFPPELQQKSLLLSFDQSSKSN